MAMLEDDEPRIDVTLQPLPTESTTIPPLERPEFLEELRFRENQVSLGLVRRNAREDKPFILDLKDFRIGDDS